MKCIFAFSILLIFCTFTTKTIAQNTFKSSIPAYTVDKGDSIKVLVIKDICVYPPQMYKDFSQDAKYQKMVRDVKKTLPYAKMIYTTLIETYEYIMTMPTEEERKKHLTRMENDLFNEYKPILKNMSLSQGKLLIKLVDRECNQTSYELVKAFLGPFRAGFWNIFAGMFGASLKSTWDPNGRDATTKRIVDMVEMGLL
jgi:hypothetical protein